MHLTAEHVSNLTLLADFMEGLVDPKFDMSQYVHVCGSPACALGWACTVPALARAGLSMSMIMRQDFDPKAVVRMIHEVFGERAFNLFHTLAPKTPQQWAAHCRAFLKENGYEVTKSDGFEKFMKKVREPVQFCPVNSNGEWV